MNQAALLGALAIPIMVVLLLLLSWHCCCRHARPHRRKDDRIGSDTSGPSYASNSTYHFYDGANVPVLAYFAQGTAIPPATINHSYQPRAPVFNNPQQRAHPYGMPYRIPRQTGPEYTPQVPQPIYNPVAAPRNMGFGYPPPPTTPTPRRTRRPRERGRSAARRAGSATASSTSSAWSRPPFPFPPYATVEDEVEWMSARSAA